MASMACLDAPYGPSNPIAFLPPTDDMNATRPFAARRAGRSAFVTAT